MTNAKPLNAKQLAVIEDLFAGESEEHAILKNHNISRKLYDKWLTDEGFIEHLDRRMVWEYRRGELMLARFVRKSVSNLMDLTKSKQSETARKACIDIITISGNCLSCRQSAQVDNPAGSPEAQPFTSETAGRLLSVLAEAKRA